MLYTSWHCLSQWQSKKSEINETRDPGYLGYLSQGVKFRLRGRVGGFVYGGSIGKSSIALRVQLLWFENRFYIRFYTLSSKRIYMQ